MKRKIAIDLSADLLARLVILCAERNVTLNELMSAVLTEHVMNGWQPRTPCLRKIRGDKP